MHQYLVHISTFPQNSRSRNHRKRCATFVDADLRTFSQPHPCRRRQSWTYAVNTDARGALHRSRRRCATQYCFLINYRSKNRSTFYEDKILMIYIVVLAPMRAGLCTNVYMDVRSTCRYLFWAVHQLRPCTLGIQEEHTLQLGAATKSPEATRVPYPTANRIHTCTLWSFNAIACKLKLACNCINNRRLEKW